MRKLLLILILAPVCLIATAQSYTLFYSLDKKLNPVPEEQAVINGKGFTENGLVKVDFFVKENGAKISSQSFTDEGLQNQSGAYKSFYYNKSIKWQGNYENNKKEGLWLRHDSLGKIMDSIVYQKGLRYLEAVYRYDKNGRPYDYHLKDSLNDISIYRTYDSTGKTIYDGKVVKGRGFLKVRENNIEKTIEVFTSVMTEAEFPGGAAAWIKFARQTLDANVPIKKRAKAGTYQVIARFIVNLDGSLSDIVSETNFGHGMEQEVIRTLKYSPKWIPATVFGVPVLAYRRQPITFVVSEE